MLQRCQNISQVQETSSERALDMRQQHHSRGLNRMRVKRQGYKHDNIQSRNCTNPRGLYEGPSHFITLWNCADDSSGAKCWRVTRMKSNLSKFGTRKLKICRVRRVIADIPPRIKLASYLPTHLAAYLNTYVPAYRSPHLPAYLPACLPTYEQTNIHTYVHTQMHKLAGFWPD